MEDVDDSIAAALPVGSHCCLVGTCLGTSLRSLLNSDKTKRAAPSHLTSSAARGYCDGPEFCDFCDFAVAQLDVRRPRPWN